MAKTATKPSPEIAPKPTMAESVRETVDSIVIAFVLAFLFRTFEAEAFVIPTGSMALTLMGDHKDLTCVQCQYPYRVSASTESPNEQGQQKLHDDNPEAWAHQHAVVSAQCPNCRYRMFFDHDPNMAAKIPPDPIPMPPSYKGDRILVTKYSYEFGNPDRWDVAVFKNPSQAKINYIKRIVGLPEEDVLIYRGDIYVRSADEQPFHMARKPPEKFLAVAQVVHDSDYVVPEIYKRGWPQRWVSEDVNSETPAWKQSDDLKSFHAEPRAGDEGWLRYRHYVPTSSDWVMLSKESLDPSQRKVLKPQLISDFCEYNGDWTRKAIRDHNVDFTYLGMHWVGDIGVECEITFGEEKNRTSDDAEAVLEIVEGGRAYQCRIRLATGDAALSISGVEGFGPTAKGAVTGAGPHRLRFANVDDRLLLWVNDKPVTFDASTNFQSVETVPNSRGGDDVLLVVDGETKFAPLKNLVPTQQDLRSPVGVAVKNCTAEVEHLRVLRDVYYIAYEADDRRRGDYSNDVMQTFRMALAGASNRPAFQLTTESEPEIAAFLSDIDVDPNRFAQTVSVLFSLEEDQYFVLGDNSPRSLDARLWKAPETYVSRELLIGKALFVYWPHALDYIPGTGIPFPFFPNFERMRMIR